MSGERRNSIGAEGTACEQLRAAHTGLCGGWGPGAREGTPEAFPPWPGARPTMSAAHWLPCQEGQPSPAWPELSSCSSRPSFQDTLRGHWGRNHFFQQNICMHEVNLSMMRVRGRYSVRTGVGGRVAGRRVPLPEPGEGVISLTFNKSHHSGRGKQWRGLLPGFGGSDGGVFQGAACLSAICLEAQVCFEIHLIFV